MSEAARQRLEDAAKQAAEDLTGGATRGALTPYLPVLRRFSKRGYDYLTSGERSGRDWCMVFWEEARRFDYHGGVIATYYTQEYVAIGMTKNERDREYAKAYWNSLNELSRKS
jgi:hypothetical protein